jgi:hypothetical protein
MSGSTGGPKGITNFHDNLCGGQHFWRTTTYKILIAGYFWTDLFTDVCEKIRACVKCQFFFGKQQLKYFPFKPVVVCGPFQEWGLDFIGGIQPVSSSHHKWILTATDYCYHMKLFRVTGDNHEHRRTCGCSFPWWRSPVHFI